MKKFILKIELVLVLITLKLNAQSGSSLTITEVMFRPAESNGEFIEIYNTSTIDTVDLKNYKIKYYTSSYDNIVEFISGTKLAPGYFAVILENNYDYENSLYQSLIPENSAVLKISDGSFGSSGMSNTTSRTVYLVDASNVVVDTYTYTANNGEGISDEKYFLNKNNNESNWRNSLIENGTPGKINSVTPVFYDLEAAIKSIEPAYPVKGDSLKVDVVVKNLGSLAAQNFSVKIFYDADGDSIGESGEEIYDNSFSSLISKDSISIENSVYLNSPGNYAVIAEIIFNEDQNKANNKTKKYFAVADEASFYNDIIVSEIMYAPPSGEPEWIELYNRTGKVINIKNWKLGDSSSRVTISAADYNLSPKEFLVVSDDSSITNFYNITSKLLVLALPAFNNSGDDVVLIDHTNKIIDSLKYQSSWGGSGKSLERILADSSSLNSQNWGTSQSEENGTPGKKNSISPKDFDIAVTSFKADKEIIEIGNRLILLAAIKNNGALDAANVKLKFYHDINSDSLPEDEEIINTKEYSSIQSGAEEFAEFTFTELNAGANQFFAVAEFAEDEFIDNNSALLTVNAVQYNEQRGDIVINEIMYAPNSPEPEWTEIFNRSEKQIQLKGYNIADNTTSTVVVKNFTTMNPGEFYVIAKDSAVLSKHPGLQNLIISEFATLNNTGDNVVLFDSIGRIIDSLEYKSSWGGNGGKSLERIDADASSIESSNWGNSISEIGSTPSAGNSIILLEYDLQLLLAGYTPAAPVENDSVQIEFLIRNQGKRTAHNFEVKIFSDTNKNNLTESNELVEEFGIDSLAKNSEQKISTALHLGKTDSCRIIAEVNFSDDQKVDNNVVTFSFAVLPLPSERNEIVINEIMYAPTGDEPEWIELFNRSERAINLKNWRVGDSGSQTLITTTDYFVEPEEYVIAARDSALLNFYNITSKIFAVTIPSLSNNGDDVILRDSYNKIIDSVKYLSSWGGNGTKSLERKSADSSSTISLNWETAVTPKRGTPGKINSISQKNFDIAVVSLNANAPIAEIGTNIQLLVSVKNNGYKAAENISVKIFRDDDFDNSGKVDEILTEIVIPLLQPEESTIKEFSADVTAGKNQFIIECDFAGDEYPENNFASLTVTGYQINEVRGDLVINEIMYAPNLPEPEWIEIFNKSSKSINLKNYYAADNSNKIKILNSGKLIYPGEYVIVARDTNFFPVHGGAANVVIAAFPSLNNSSDAVVLIDSISRVIDSVTYKSSWGGSGGKSLERIDASAPSIDSTNWKSSPAIGGTPGKINSVSKKNFDPALSGIVFTNPSPFNGDGSEIIAVYKNLGKNEAAMKLILRERLDDGNKILLEESESFNVSAGDTSWLLYKFNYKIEKIRIHHTYEIEIVCNEDENLTNNIIAKTIRAAYLPNAIKINEIMYNPVNGEPEWIEIFNDSDYDIDFDEWTLSDILAIPVSARIKNVIVPAHKYFVIAKDSTIKNFHNSIPSQIVVSSIANLNNDKDGIVFKDSRGVVIDSMMYQSNWGGENGKSLERINLNGPSLEKENWNSSRDIELSTPGRINSVTRKNFDLAVVDISTVPNFPDMNEQVYLSALVVNNGLQTSDDFAVEYYLINGNDTTYFEGVNCKNLLSGDSVFVQSLNKIRIADSLNVFVKIIFDNDEAATNNFLEKSFYAGSSKNSVLISEIMYSPLDNETEWIEIINSTNAVINLKDWSAADLLPLQTKAKITADDFILEPHRFAVIAIDTSKYFYDTPNKIFQTKFGSLGNSFDGIIIYDNRGAVIDSVFYNSSWGSRKGFSLERLSYSVSSNDSTNWTTSFNRYGATPGFKNSSTGIPVYSNGTIIINEVMYEPADGNCEFVEFFNNGNDSVQIGGMHLLIGRNNSKMISQTLLKIPPQTFFILASDTTVFQNYSWLDDEKGFVLLNKDLSLPNNGSELVIKDLKNRTIDSVFYSSSMHNKNILSVKGKSLERINPQIGSIDKMNWSTSVSHEGATPCKENSIFTKTLVSESKVTLSPNPFSPDNDGFEDFTTINFNLSQKIVQVRIKVFDSIGRFVRTLAHNLSAASNGSIIFDGLDDSGKPLRLGIYILLIEIINDSGFSETIKTPVVVARKL
ncbi:MAG: lamin tail domain-containing protein [Ignavibacteriales bacterium]|nr:lamin tail domain-containing protein [Ignavibacteriales bacterium]